MPLYSYKCECGKFDAYNSVEDYREKADCPKCGKPSPRWFSGKNGVSINMRGTRGITSRTDVEIDTMSQEQSMRELAQ